jgi:hypothetical protein
MIAVVLVGLLSLSGCKVKSVNHIPAASVAPPLPKEETIVGVTTLKGEDLRFDPPGATIADGKVSGRSGAKPLEVPLDQVQRFWVQTSHISTARTIGLVAGIAVATVVVVVAVAAALKQSCPFVYSWDGKQYVFDAEPYGGAIARGLEKDDYSELGQLRAQDGRYKLRITNEVDETQMTNLAELWVVDHPAGTRVVPDIDGKLHTLSAPQEMVSASDAEGHDLRPWLRSTDRLILEAPSAADAAGNLQGDITMTFPKPSNAKQVKLVANAATGLWGSYMIKRMVELRGRETGKFIYAVNHSAKARKQLEAWELREELYRLKVYVEEPTGWEVRGVLPGTGPFISKDRILPLDVSHVKGDQLRIRIHPPAGFWALNSFAVDYSADQPIKMQTLKPGAAEGSQAKSVLADLASVDGRYLAMPNIGDTADLSFAEPASTPGMERAVFLHSRGYYKLHMKETGEPDTKMLEAFDKVPGSAARYAATQFGEWQIAKQQIQ